jgi:hypothetical protein
MQMQTDDDIFRSDLDKRGITEMDVALDWCASVLGPVQVMSDHSKAHGGHESSTHRIHVSTGYCYLKLHRTPAHWNNEVHAYERWAGAFGDFAPRLLAVRDEEPPPRSGLSGARPARPWSRSTNWVRAGFLDRAPAMERVPRRTLGMPGNSSPRNSNARLSVLFALGT